MYSGSADDDTNLMPAHTRVERDCAQIKKVIVADEEQEAVVRGQSRQQFLRAPPS